MNEQLIEKHLFESKHQDVAKRAKTTSVFLSFLLILLGIVSLLVSSRFEKVAAEITLTLMLLGSCFLLLGIYLLIWKSKTLVYEPTGSKVLRNSAFFDISEQNKLEKMIKSGVFSSEVIKTNEKGCVRLDFLISEDSQFVAVQLFQFSSFKFTADTPITYFRGEQAVGASAFLKQFN
jgi:hypothetical protein